MNWKKNYRTNWEAIESQYYRLSNSIIGYLPMICDTSADWEKRDRAKAISTMCKEHANSIQPNDGKLVMTDIEVMKLMRKYTDKYDVERSARKQSA